MNIFISYSTGDLKLVRKLAEGLELYADVFYWDKNKEPGEEVWPKIFEWIDKADKVIAVITDKTVSRGLAVGQEIGRAKAKGKIIIPLVLNTVDSSELGFLSGITYVPFSENNSIAAFQEIMQCTIGRNLNLMVPVESDKQSAGSDYTLFIILGILLLLAIFSGGEEEEEYYYDPKPKRRKRKYR
jgi:hypothetical protein